MILPLFVYGTLLSKGPRSGLLGDRSREQATVRGTLYHLSAGYPALQLSGEGDVHGELVHGVDAQLLSILDFYEDVASGLYRRVEVDARVGIQRLQAQTYVMDRPWERSGRVVKSGRWTIRTR